MSSITFSPFSFLIILLFNCDSKTQPTLRQGQPVSAAEETGIEILAQDLEVPWGMDFLPDGRLIFNERSGNINVLNMESKSVKKLMQREILDRSEGGLLGLAVDPDFNSTRYIFIYETVETGNRIVRLKFENDLLQLDKIIVQNIPKMKFHDGGILRFGPDGYLYAGTGDARDPNSAQDLKSNAGKILRMDKDGNAAPGNPFNNLIWSYGHRNVQGLCWDGNGNMFASEHGPSGEINGWCCHDELNYILKGGNYGWPHIIGDNNKEGMIVPIAHSGEVTWAPGGIEWVLKNNTIVMACLRGEKLIRFNLQSSASNDRIFYTNATIQEEMFQNEYKRLRNIVQSPVDGSLVFCSSNKDGREMMPLKNDDKIYQLKTGE